MARLTTTPKVLRALGLVLAMGCGGPNYPYGEPSSADAGATFDGGVACLPNVDGVIDDAELPVVVGASEHLIITQQPHPAFVAGSTAGGGRQWDLSARYGDDRTIEVTTAPAQDQWFADRFADAHSAYVAPLDVDGTMYAVLMRTAGLLRTLGSASSVEAPSDGQTLLVYDTPVELFRLPLRVGDQWTSAAQVVNGKVRGLPIAARQSYSIEVRAEGALLLPDLTFERVLQVIYRVHQETVAGPATDWVQVSFVAECYGEVARLTSPMGTTDVNFAEAAEIRRLGF